MRSLSQRDLVYGNAFDSSLPLGRDRPVSDDHIEFGGAASVLLGTRFTGWGSRVSIKAPPANKVTTKLEDKDGLP
ncbi:hypothetical protein [Streptosporangium sp. NPDC002607]